MKNDVPIIGEPKPECTFCGGPYAEAIHPKAGKVMAPVCNCARPVFIGDLKKLKEHLEPLTGPCTTGQMVDLLLSILEGAAKKDRGQ